MVTSGSSCWSRRFIVLSTGYLVLWRFGTLLGVSRRTEIVLALFGFVFHMVFGMGYLLIPSYFERVLVARWPPAIHLGLTGVGTGLLALASVRDVPPFIELSGASAWCLGVVLFLGTLLWTIRGNLMGRDTGTSADRAAFQGVDRYANAFVPIALAYLAIGSYEVLARVSVFPGVTDGYVPRITHLLAAGFAALLVFALGVRLAPRFLGVPAPKLLVAVVLPAGALGPALIASGLGGGITFVIGALAEATAVFGFAVLFVVLFVRSEREKVGFFGVLAGVLSGVAGVTLGLSFAFGPITAAMITAHLQLNLLGFLGLTIVGFTMQFFPPTAGRFWGANDRTALLVILSLICSLLLIVFGNIGEFSLLITLGNGLALTGVLGYGYLVVRLMFAIGSRQSRR